MLYQPLVTSQQEVLLIHLVSCLLDFFIRCSEHRVIVDAVLVCEVIRVNLRRHGHFIFLLLAVKRFSFVAMLLGLAHIPLISICLLLLKFLLEHLGTDMSTCHGQ